MGSLFSKPDIPNQYSYAQTYTPPAATSSGGATTAGDGTAPSSDGSSTDAARVAAIVRGRSFPDTIQTSWRGVLQPGDWVPQRKSLLGE